MKRIGFIIFGGDGTGGIAEMALKVDLSMDRKMYEFSNERIGFMDLWRRWNWGKRRKNT
jgi:hypothetical protein